jgi:Transposase IS4
MVELTNENLLKDKQKLTRPCKILRFFGVMILMTRFKFGKRESMWSSKMTSKYIPAPKFGITGIARSRFRELRSAMRFSQHGDDTTYVIFAASMESCAGFRGCYCSKTDMNVLQGFGGDSHLMCRTATK